MKSGFERWPSAPEGGIVLQMAKKTSPQRPFALDDARLRQQAIGVQLRQMFEDVVKEPVPSEFLDILREADGDSADAD